MSRRSCGGSAFNATAALFVSGRLAVRGTGGSAVASSPSLSSGHQSCQSSPTPSPPDHRRAGKLASGAARPAQFRFAASHTRRCPSGSPRSASSSSVCRHGWDLLGGQHMTARDVPNLPLRATCSKMPCRNGAASPVTLRVRNCSSKLLWDSGRPSISFDVRPSALGLPRKMRGSAASGSRRVIRNRTGVCRERQALEIP